MVCQLGPVLAALVSRWGKCPWLGGSSVGGFPRCPWLPTTQRAWALFNCAAPPTAPSLPLSISQIHHHQLLRPLAVPQQLTFAFSNPPLGSPRGSCHSLVSYFVSLCWKNLENENPQNYPPPQYPNLRQSLHLPPFSDALIDTTICNLTRRRCLSARPSSLATPTLAQTFLYRPDARSNPHDRYCYRER